MNFFDAIKICFIKYTNFSDRASRSEFWLFYLFTSIVNLILLVVNPDPYASVSMIFTLATVIPSTAVLARRLHDINRSGWWYLIALTVIGIIPLIYWFCKKGDQGENQFGDQPLAWVICPREFTEAGEAGTEYAAKKIEMISLAKVGLEP